ncbi:MAG: DinB family protein [Parafilimonas sp.]|nr:DinB family protein [Parafilimonas sp.]
MEVYEGNNWTDVNIAGTIEDVSCQQAQQKTVASQNTIAALLHHLYYWNGIMMQRANGENPSIPAANGFDVDELKNENDWNDLKEKTHQSFIELANAVTNFPEEKLNETSPTGRSSYYKNFQGIVEHAHYHLGQMVMIKRLLT